VVDPKQINGKKWRAEEEDSHKGSLTHKKEFAFCTSETWPFRKKTKIRVARWHIFEPKILTRVNFGGTCN
jgi:hypothetical protein